MRTLNIDFRDGCLRLLVVKDDAPTYSKIVKDFHIDNEKSASERLASEIKQAGWRRSRINVILPFHIINYKTYKTPPLEIEDVGKIIRREIAKELQGENFSFSIKRIKKGAYAEQQEILAEYVLEADTMKYLKLLKACRVKPHMITSSLNSNALLLNKQRPVTEGNEAVIDIGFNFIEVAVFNNKNLLMYDRLPISHFYDEKIDKQTPFEHRDKIKIYKIVETLYQFIMRYSKNFPEEKLSLLWLCGINSLTEGITDSLSDGLGVEARVLNPFKIEIENGSALSALAGISTVSRDEQFINLLPVDILEKRPILLKRIFVAASLSFYIILLVSASIVLNILEKDMKQTHEKIASDKFLLINRQGPDTVYSYNQKAYAKLISGSTNLYSIFRDIANLIPSGVVLENIDIEKVNGITNLKIEANLQYSDETFKNAVLSKFLTSLNSSSRLRQMMPPEISVKKTSDEQKEISVVVKYEVL